MDHVSTDMNAFRELVKNCKSLVVLTGAGVSAESGVPTFRGAGGLWRRWNAMDLASPDAFQENKSLVWEFYHYRREVMGSKCPNAAHVAIAECEKRFKSEGRKLTVVTQNIDGLHKQAGSERILELHGNLFKTRCLKCGDVAVNTDSPICEALQDKGAPDPSTPSAAISDKDLPRCKISSCGGLLRPHVIWFGEKLDSDVLEEVHKELDACDLCMLVGTSSVVYPAAGFAPHLSARGVPVGEFNMETTPATSSLGYHFHGPAGENVPKALEP